MRQVSLLNAHPSVVIDMSFQVLLVMMISLKATRIGRSTGVCSSRRLLKKTSLNLKNNTKNLMKKGMTSRGSMKNLRFVNSKWKYILEVICCGFRVIWTQS